MSKFAGKAGNSLRKLEEQIDFDKPRNLKSSKSAKATLKHTSTTKLDYNAYRLQLHNSKNSQDRNLIFHESSTLLPSIPTTLESSKNASRISNLHGKDPKKSDNLKPSSKSNLLGTMDGVFLPTVLNIFGIIVFIRLGYCVGQAGILLTMGMFLFGYIVTTSTSLSVSAIATNGTIKGYPSQNISLNCTTCTNTTSFFILGGGPYYMLSRTLGPEFGGSIGLIFYIGVLLASSLNAVSFAEPLLNNFGKTDGTLFKILPDSNAWTMFYQAMILVFSTLVCMFGSKLFATANNFLSIIIGSSVISILVSFWFQEPFSVPERNVYYTGLSWSTFSSNLYPDFSQDINGNKITLGSTFGVLFPACVGIMTGVSLSGSLRKPNVSIPKGTLYAVALTLTVYLSMVLSLGSSVRRETLKKNMNVFQEIGLLPVLVPLGAISTTITSLLTGILSASNILRAISMDDLFGILYIFKQTGDTENVNAIIATSTICLSTLFLGDVNFVASYVTLFSLMMFMSTNFALLVLKSVGAINFRPSFQYYNIASTITGVLGSFLAMIFVDAFSTVITILVTIILMLYIKNHPIVVNEWHNSWGDVTQGLIYHQVRKYLLQLRQEEMHIKYWRPQILLIMSNPYNHGLVKLCNEMKKGGLYILGIVKTGDDFITCLEDVKNHEKNLINYIESHHYKAFAKASIASTFSLGVRQLVMSSGLGGMRPNIVVMDIDDVSITPCELVQSIEESLQLKKSIGLACNFNDIHLNFKEEDTVVIDLWPLKVSDSEQLVYMSNYDSYTMVLQLGSILKTQFGKKSRCVLRMFSFVENEFELQSEKALITELLVRLRIIVDLKMIVLSSFDFYKQTIKDQTGKKKFKTQDSGTNKTGYDALPSGNINIIDKKKPFPINRRQSLQHDINIHKFLNSTSLANDSVLQDYYSNLGIDSLVIKKKSLDSQINRQNTPTNITLDSQNDCTNDFSAVKNHNMKLRNVSMFENTNEYLPLSLNKSSKIALPHLSDEPSDASFSDEENIGFFNTLSQSAQSQILNKLMKTFSSNHCNLIITACPVPNIGFSKNPTVSAIYVDNLKQMVEDIQTPILLVHTTTLSVTTLL
ncbi:hypothetical protein BB561_000495 [Smittium simulii]|uniref:Amino acid permease/ SLC12A domain-containing protein n=1 Tax=Smittium simulii TaxID=133385 RepID=A0A2T9YYR1_9FUNG|nr:hypothetical protein BB561_000495 [Smittium simulii]